MIKTVVGSGAPTYLLGQVGPDHFWQGQQSGLGTFSFVSVYMAPCLLRISCERGFCLVFIVLDNE